MCCGMLAAIVGGTPNETALNAVSNGGLNLSVGLTLAQKAAALATLLASADVNVAVIDGIDIATFG